MSNCMSVLLVQPLIGPAKAHIYQDATTFSRKIQLYEKTPLPHPKKQLNSNLKISAYLLGCVQPTIPYLVYPSSCRYCVNCVVFPDPVSPTTITTWVKQSIYREAALFAGILRDKTMDDKLMHIRQILHSFFLNQFHQQQ